MELINHTNYLFGKVFHDELCFYKYLLSAGDFLQTHNSLLEGLQHANYNKDSPRVVFINSKCADKGFLCINCEEKEYENTLTQLNEIIKLHNLKQHQIKDVFSNFK